MPASICIRQTPVSACPSTMARLIGPAPRSFGSNEACTLTHPRRGASSTAWGRIRPYAITTATSASSARRDAANSAVRTFLGCVTSSPRASARSFTGGGRSFMPRPAGRSG